MTKQDETAGERDDLELQPETIKDLDVSDEHANELRGGNSAPASGSRAPGASK